MYYVIKQQTSTSMQHFIGFVVDRYIASKNSDTVIFEFTKDGKNERKWVKKSEIILLTQEKVYFLEIFNQLKSAEALQQELVNHAKEHLEESILNFDNTMKKEIDKIQELKNCGNVSCILSDL